MNDPAENMIAILLEEGRFNVIVEICVLDIVDNSALCKLSLEYALDTIVNPEIEYPVAFFGYDLKGFTDKLDRALENREGTIRLQDCDATTILCFTFEGGLSQNAIVGGNLRLFGEHTELHCADAFLGQELPRSGIEVRFDGLKADPPAISQFLRSINEFLRKSGIDLDNPYPPSMFLE